MEKLAIIDMGSNSIRFVVMQIADNQSYSLLYQEKEAIRLGHGLSQTGVISEEGMQRALTCLHVYKHIMEVMDIHECRGRRDGSRPQCQQRRSFPEAHQCRNGHHHERHHR